VLTEDLPSTGVGWATHPGGLAHVNPLKISCREAGHCQPCRQAGEETSPDPGDSRGPEHRRTDSPRTGVNLPVPGRRGALVRRPSRLELIFAVRGHAGLLRSDRRRRVWGRCCGNAYHLCSPRGPKPLPPGHGFQCSGAVNARQQAELPRPGRLEFPFVRAQLRRGQLAPGPALVGTSAVSPPPPRYLMVPA
jgi:hypothetical protein